MVLEGKPRKLIQGVNDLATTHPELAKQAVGWDPETVTAGSNKKRRWICEVGHHWDAVVWSRALGPKSGCPTCANKQVLIGFNDLGTTHPELAKQAVGWDPKTVIAGSGKKVKWKCKLDHQWDATVTHRAAGPKSGCPTCANKQVLSGFNDLATTHPELAKQAVGWDPETVTAGSGKKLKWKCKLDHHWNARVADRALGETGCPTCAGKQVLIGFNDLGTTHPELAQQAVGWDPETVTAGSGKKVKWICEVGHKWDATVTHRALSESGCPFCSGKKVLIGFNDLATTHPRLAKQAVRWNPETVSAGSNKKCGWICELGHRWDAIVASRALSGHGCAICSGQRVLAGFNDLATTHPELAKQAVGWDPETVTAGSSRKKVKWICDLGHRWDAIVASRALIGDGCPFCSGHRVLIGFNDLVTTHPHFAKQVVGWDPKTLSAGSRKKVKWKCELGHQWDAVVNSRVHYENGCPICGNKQVLIGFNDLATTHPELVKQAVGWDPKTVTAGSGKKVKWKCGLGHQWDAWVAGRAMGPESGCPTCAGKKVLIGFNDLATTHPDIAQQAVGWDPETVSAGSSKKRRWICELGHQLDVIISDRTNGHGCAICSGQRVLAGFNDLATTHPELAKQAVGWDPETVTAGSSRKKVKWICDLGHRWDAIVASRASGQKSGCPSCAKFGFDPNEDGYLYFLSHPDWEMLQIGITNSPEDRLNDHKRLGWEILEVRGPMDGLLTRGWETSILQMLKKRGAKLAPDHVAGKFSGYTEAWVESSFPIKSIKELMRMVETDE